MRWPSFLRLSFEVGQDQQVNEIILIAKSEGQMSNVKYVPIPF
jgi:hypothetical protein